jgi:hypothetical protein
MEAAQLTTIMTGRTIGDIDMINLGSGKVLHHESYIEITFDFDNELISFKSTDSDRIAYAPFGAIESVYFKI